MKISQLVDQDKFIQVKLQEHSLIEAKDKITLFDNEKADLKIGFFYSVKIHSPIWDLGLKSLTFSKKLLISGTSGK